MKRTATIYILLFLSLSAFGQNLNFQSIVLEKDTTTPIEGAVITIEDSGLMERTDKLGRFVFKKQIPLGEHIVTVSKQKYETTYFLITSEINKKILVEKIELTLNKFEANKRKKENNAAIAAARKKAAIDSRKIKAAKKQKRDRERALAKKVKKLKKKNTVKVSYKNTKKPEPKKIIVYKPAPVPQPEPETISEAQFKYSEILNVPLETVSNKALYDFIDEWYGTPYVFGGETKDGIDCSSFAQRLHIKAYDDYIERTAEKQYNSRYTDKFLGKEFLQEGDLIFFKGLAGSNRESITHVGVYLHNNKFVHATSSKATEGVKGVKISDLTDQYWSKRYVAGGRRTPQ